MSPCPALHLCLDTCISPEGATRGAVCERGRSEQPGAMGNTYGREDSFDSNGRTSRSSSLLRKYSKSLKWREAEESSGERAEQESGGEVEAPPPQLTEEQREVVKRTWKIIEASVAKVGVVLFMG